MKNLVPTNWAFWRLLSAWILLFHGASIGRGAPQSEPVSVEVIVQKASGMKSLIRNMIAEYDVTWEWHTDTVERKKANLSLQPYSVKLIYDKERRFCEVTTSGRSSTARKASFDGDYTVKYTIGSAIVSDGKETICEDLYYVTEFLNIPLTDKDRATAERGWFYPRGLLPPSNLPFTLPGEKAFHITSNEKIDNSACYVVEMPKSTKFWVDPSIGYMYRRREQYYTDGEDVFLQSRYLLGDFREVTPGIWLPFDCTREDYPGSLNPRERRNQKSLSLHVTVRHVSLNTVTDDDFKLVIPAGTLVSGPSGSYIIPGDNTVTLDQFSELARKTAHEAERGGWMNTVLILLLLATAIAAIGRWVAAKRAQRDFKSAIEPKQP